jgi:hypothetical protein
MKQSQQSSNISWGISLVVVGVIFLLDNIGILDANLYNWWAIFILMPGFNMLYNTWNTQKDNRGNIFQNSSFLPGILLTGLGFSFLLDINWDMIFPVVIILIGVFMLSRK